MLISPIRQSAADRQSGFTLIELLMAIGIGGLLSLMISTFLLGTGKIQKTVTLRAEIESLRSLTLPKIDCNASCAGLTAGDKNYGPWVVKTECHALFQDAKVTYSHENLKELKGALFTLDSWVCKPRRPKQCIYACHNYGVMLEKGYLYPSVEGARNMTDSDFNCPIGELVGVDFSTNRIVCEKKNDMFASGPMCKQDVTLVVGPDEPHMVSISGRNPCTQHTQDQARLAILNGSLKVEISETFTPSSSDRFVIIRAEKISGQFRNPGHKIFTGKHSFDIKYNGNSVYLTGYKKIEK